MLIENNCRSSVVYFVVKICKDKVICYLSQCQLYAQRHVEVSIVVRFVFVLQSGAN